MDSWQIEQLNDMTCGDVAIRVHRARKELDQAATERANAASAMIDAERAYERAKELYREKANDERDLSRELRGLESYLEQRLEKELS